MSGVYLNLYVFVFDSESTMLKPFWIVPDALLLLEGFKLLIGRSRDFQADSHRQPN